jgi:BirA family biotin operon repressor/biotin-[acetyl-CoA-carboxylase] ligase
MPSRLRQIFEEHPGRFVSGEEISRRLGVTRAAVWKQVRTLRSQGYEIEGARGAGYRLGARPDVIRGDELISRLAPDSVFKSFRHLPVTDSTNTRAAEYAEQGAPDGTVVCADSQTAGRGRLGRKWDSPPGLNLYLTLLLRPPIDPWRAPQLTLTTAVALAQGVEESTGLACSLKWPNDLYIGGRKAAGILAEMAADPDALRHVSIGVGLNVNGQEGDFTEDIRCRATSLRIQAGRRFHRDEVLVAFLNRFSAAYRLFLREGFGAIRPEWDRRALLDGRRILLRRGNESEWGVAVGVDDEGVLRFRREGSGREEMVHSGEIIEFER